MAHTVRKINLGNTALAQVTFTSYTAGQGGEAFTLAEFGLTGSLVNVEFLQTVDAVTGSECLARYTTYVGAGKVKLLNPATLQELSTTASLSWTVFVAVIGT